MITGLQRFSNTLNTNNTEKKGISVSPLSPALVSLQRRETPPRLCVDPLPI